jgi:phage recombination protein Bet
MTTDKMMVYQAGAVEVKLSKTIVRMYLARGTGNVSDQEIVMFMGLCEAQNLNPFNGDCYLVKYGNYPAALIVAKQVFACRAEGHPKYRGYNAGVTVMQKDGTLERRKGSLVLPGEKLVAGWAEVYRADRESSAWAEVALTEYEQRKKDGQLNSMWAGKPATMVRKVALCHAWREAFPKSYENMYSEEEFGELPEQRAQSTSNIMDKIKNSPVIDMSDDDGGITEPEPEPPAEVVDMPVPVPVHEDLDATPEELEFLRKSLRNKRRREERAKASNGTAEPATDDPEPPQDDDGPPPVGELPGPPATNGQPKSYYADACDKMGKIIVDGVLSTYDIDMTGNIDLEQTIIYKGIIGEAEKNGWRFPANPETLPACVTEDPSLRDSWQSIYDSARGA